jgi:MFS family permease
VTNPSPTAKRTIFDFLGLQRDMLILLSMVILVGLGEKMAERFLPLYLFALGGGALSVGLLNGLDNLLSALYSYPGGYVTERLGTRRALLLFNLLAMLGYLIVIVVPSWQAVILGSFFFISWTAISLPATMELVAAVLPINQRTMGVSMHSLVRRIPMALGPVLGGAAIGWLGEVRGVRLAFGAALVLAGASLLLQRGMLTGAASRRVPGSGAPPSGPGADGQPPPRAGPRSKATRMAQSRSGRSAPSGRPQLLSPALRRLLVSDILIRFCEQIPYAFVVIWAVQLNGITPLQFGWLSAIEMATAVLVYIPVAYLADRSTKKPFVLITFGFFTLFPLLLLASHSFPMLALAFVVRGLKEFGEPTRKALIMDLAPEGRKAGAFGLYYLLRDVVVSLAAFGGAFLWDASAARRLTELLRFGQGLLPQIERLTSPATNLLVAAGFGAIGTLLFALFGTDLRSEAPWKPT